MATKQAAASKAVDNDAYAHLEDGTIYRAVVSRPFKVGRSWVRPGPGVSLKGKVIKEHADGIAEVHPQPE